MAETLVVDDDLYINELAKIYLDRDGFSVESATRSLSE
jgi:DNA-binding response OmpR family regulator